MSEARQHSFATLFSSVQGVEIPIIQRDYAQGRQQSKDVLSDFLTSLRDALLSDEHKALDLDFVYGTFEDGRGKVLSLLDGQQRLTTLFLLHWYVAVCEARLEDFRARWTKNGRSRFTYATRPSSAEFFHALATADSPPPSTELAPGSLSRQLVERNWFFLSWNSDPTVRACLSTLDAIAQTFGTTKGLYERLVDEQKPRITFHFLDLERFGLTDDLYIKMNARGKPLTPFENFKAWLVGRVSGERWASRFDLAMDQKWMDIFWRIAPKQQPLAVGPAVDDLYLRFMYVMAFFNACNRVERAFGAPEATISWIGHLRTARGYIALRELEGHNAFTPAAVEVVSVVLDHFADAPSVKDLATLEQGLGRNSDVLDLIRLFALVAWLTSPAAKSGLPQSAVAKSRWDRVVTNLIGNHRIEEVHTIIGAIKGLQELAASAENLYEMLSTSKSLPSGFNSDQTKEEVRKAQLIVEDPTREKLFVQAEAHSYLQGRIEFLLDFSRRSDGSFDRNAFVRYSQRARAVLEEKIRTSPTRRLERALLSIDDYLIERGSSKFSFCQPDGNTFRDRSDNWLKVVGRPGFRALLDRIDGDAAVALDAVIAQSECSDWRKYVIAESKLIDYCGERLIHRDDYGDIYLLSRKRLSGYHAELKSYALFLSLEKTGTTFPGTSYRYEETYDVDPPALILNTGQHDLRIRQSAGSWRCDGPTEEVAIPVKLTKFMSEHGFA